MIFRVNRYLAKSNETLFKPNGLFCLIVKYQPDEQMTIAQNALRSGRSLVKTKALERLGMLEDISDGDRLIATIPPSAPLIFPPPPSKDNDKGLKRAVTRRHDRKAQENYVCSPLPPQRKSESFPLFLLWSYSYPFIHSTREFFFHLKSLYEK